MSKDKKSSVSTLSLDELTIKEREITENLFKLRLQKTTGQLTNTSLLRTTRKSLARVKTAMTQKSQAAKA